MVACPEGTESPDGRPLAGLIFAFIVVSTDEEASGRGEGEGAWHVGLRSCRDRGAWRKLVRRFHLCKLRVDYQFITHRRTRTSHAWKVLYLILSRAHNLPSHTRVYTHARPRHRHPRTSYL